MYNQPMALTYHFYGMLKVIVSDDIETKWEIRVRNTDLALSNKIKQKKKKT